MKSPRLLTLATGVALALTLAACADTTEPVTGGSEPSADDIDAFAPAGKADASGSLRFQPEAGPLELELPAAREGDQLFYQPYVVETEVTDEGQDVDVYQPEGAWRQVWRYRFTVLGEAQIAIDTTITHPGGGLLGGMVNVQLYRLAAEGSGGSSEKIAGAPGSVVADVTAGSYGVAVLPALMPVQTEAEEAYLAFDLSVGPTSEREE